MTAQPLHPCPLPVASRHYLLRNNVMVPLVPVDQLPFQLQGVPRQLSHRQMSEEGWKFVDESKEQVSLLTILAPTTPLAQPVTPPKSKHLPPDHDIRREATPPARDVQQFLHAPRFHAATAVSSTPPPPTDTSILERSSANVDRFARFEYRLPYPSGIEPDPSKKVYCTHWIKTGECAFTSIGCKYKHEMPSVEKLRELGFTLGTPKWFQEKAAIAARGPTWMQRRLAERASSQELADASTNSVLRSQSVDTRGHPHERDQTRGVSGYPSSLRPSLAPPLESMKPPVPSVDCIPDLLIDIDDSSFEDSSPTSSAQSSVSSTSSTESEAPKKSTKKSEQGRRVVRCCPPAPVSSESEYEAKATKPLSKRGAAAHKLATRTATLSKQAGLSGSKYAAAANAKECHIPSSQHKTTTRALSVQTKSIPLKQKTIRASAGHSRSVSKTAIPAKKVVA